MKMEYESEISELNKTVLDLYRDFTWMNEDLHNKNEYLGKTYLKLITLDSNKYHYDPWEHLDNKYEKINCAYEMCLNAYKQKVN